MEERHNPIRGIRGAVTVEEDQPGEIHQATLTLFEAILQENNLQVEEVSAVIVTMTPDLCSTFPARGIREREEYRYLPLMCAQEIPVTGAIEKCIRLLVLAYCPLVESRDLRHVYSGRARCLREDLGGE